MFIRIRKEEIELLGFNKLIAGILFITLCLILGLTGCNFGQFSEEKARQILDNYTEQMIACYANPEQEASQKCRDTLEDKIYKENPIDEDSKAIFERVLMTWKTQCEALTEERRYALYVVKAPGTDNPVEDKIVKTLEDKGFSVGYLEPKSLEVIAGKFDVPAEKLKGDKVALLYNPETVEFMTEKIKDALEKLPEISEVEMIPKDNDYKYSFGIYVPAA